MELTSYYQLYVLFISIVYLLELQYMQSYAYHYNMLKYFVRATINSSITAIYSKGLNLSKILPQMLLHICDIHTGVKK